MTNKVIYIPEYVEQGVAKLQQAKSILSQIAAAINSGVSTVNASGYNRGIPHIEKGDKAFIIEAPQLFESGLDKNCDLIIAVLADHQTLVERIVYRDNISIEMAEKRLKNQYDDGFFQEHADFVIHNSRSDDPKEQVINILKKIGLTT